jgi:phage shock protein C
MIAEDRPRELSNDTPEDKRFWQQVRLSPTRTARDIRMSLKAIDRRLGDVESYVLTNNRSLAREIEELR